MSLAIMKLSYWIWGWFEQAVWRWEGIVLLHLVLGCLDVL